MANAAVVGFLPSHRVVLLSDALLAQLGPAELAAVFAHEVGHVTRRHVWILGAWALGFVLLADAGLRLVALDSAVWELAILGGLLGLGYLAFGFLSRRFELDADLASVTATGDTDGLVRALEQVGGAHARERTGWRHFSTGRRVRFLHAHAADPRLGARLRRTLRWWARAGALVFLAAIALELWTFARALPEDRVVVALRLGHYVEAVRRAEDLESVDPRLAGALQAAAETGPSLSPEALLADALARLEAGDLAGALARADLASLRGATAPVGVQAVLAALLERDAEAARAALERVVPSPWRDALERRR